MADSTLTINGIPESFGSVWIHIQPVRSAPAAKYRVRIHKDHAGLIFEGTDKEDHISWNDYLTKEACELGSTIISIYFERLAQISGVTQESCRWVIATLDAVIEDNEYMELHGLAIPFDPERFFA